MPTDIELHQFGGTAAVVGGVVLSAGCILRTMFENTDATQGVGAAGAIVTFIFIMVAAFGYMRNWMGSTKNDPEKYYATIFASIGFATVAVWTVVRMFAYKETLSDAGGCGHASHTETLIEPAFMEIGVAGNSEIDIVVAITMALIMGAYYFPLIMDDRGNAAENAYIKITYSILCAASVANIGIVAATRVALGGPSPTDNVNTHIEAIAHYRVTSMALVALQLILAGALSISSRRTEEGKDSFFAAEPSGEKPWIIVLHRVLQFLFATATFVGAIVLAFATGAFHTENPTTPVMVMACESEAAFDQNATGSSLFAFLIPYLLSVWWDMTKL